MITRFNNPSVTRDDNQFRLKNGRKIPVFYYAKENNLGPEYQRLAVSDQFVRHAFTKLAHKAIELDERAFRPVESLSLLKTPAGDKVLAVFRDDQDQIVKKLSVPLHEYVDERRALKNVLRYIENKFSRIDPEGYQSIVFGNGMPFVEEEDGVRREVPASPKVSNKQRNKKNSMEDQIKAGAQDFWDNYSLVGKMYRFLTKPSSSSGSSSRAAAYSEQEPQKREFHGVFF